MKKCRNCEHIKNENEFYKRSTNIDGLYSYCKECTLAKNKNPAIWLTSLITVILTSKII